MTAEELDAIEARAAAATPGPWHYNSYSAVYGSHADYDRLEKEWEAAGEPPADKGTEWWDRFYDADPDVAHVPAHHGDTAVRRRKKDAEFIAHARSDVPRLVAEIRRLRKELLSTRERCAALVEGRARHKLPCSCDSCRQSTNDAAAIRRGG
jgi:hypothetical protein